MKQGRGKIWICLIVITVSISVSCKYDIYKKKNAVNDIKRTSESTDNEFYYAFTTATKNAMFRNYKQAVRDYRQCLRYKKNSPAIHFQLSNIYLKLGNIDLAKSHADSAVIYDKTENKWYLMQLANIYSIKNNIDSTIILYEKMIDIEPENVELKYKLALLYEEKKEYEKALGLLNECENIIGVSDMLLVSKHDIYSKLGNETEAVNELRKAIDYYPENYNLLGLMAEYYADIKEFKKAEEYYILLMNKDPENVKALFSYADYLFENDENERAFSYYRQIINNDDINIDLKISLMVNFLREDSLYSGYYKQIGVLIEDLKDKYTDNVKVRTLCADFYIRVNKLQEASSELSFVLQTEKDNYVIWEQLLYIENSLENYDSVITISSRAIEIFTEEPVLYLFNGIALLQKGNSESAVQSLEKGIKYASNSEQEMQFLNFMAEAYKNLENYKKSDSAFEKVLEIDPENLLVRNNYSYYLALREENLDRAEKLSKLTVEIEPKNSTYLDTYGWILYKKGDKAKARKYIEKAIKNGGSRNSEILNHYGDILYDLSDSESAIFYWNEAIKYSNNDFEILEKIKRAEQQNK